MTGVIGQVLDSSYIFMHGPGILLNTQLFQGKFKIKLLIAKKSVVRAEIGMKQHRLNCLQLALS